MHRLDGQVGAGILIQVLVVLDPLVKECLQVEERDPVKMGVQHFLPDIFRESTTGYQ